jgi:hypothetical protein
MGHCREKWCMVGGVGRRGCREVTTIEGTGAEEEWLASGRGGPHRGSNRGGGGGGGGGHGGKGEEWGRWPCSGVEDEAPVVTST